MDALEIVALVVLVIVLLKTWRNEGRIDAIEERVGSKLDDESVSEPTPPAPDLAEKVAELQLRVRRLEARVPGHMTIGEGRRR